MTAHANKSASHSPFRTWKFWQIYSDGYYVDICVSVSLMEIVCCSQSREHERPVCADRRSFGCWQRWITTLSRYANII